MKHIPKLPWRIEAGGLYGTVLTIKDFSDNSIFSSGGDCGTMRNPEPYGAVDISGESAAFICLAVNHHEKLVEMVKEFMQLIKHALPQPEQMTVYSKATALLNKLNQTGE
jgi:hypothetical protein